MNHKVIQVHNDLVFIEGEDGLKTIDAVHKIVVATGMKSYVPFDKIGTIPVYFIGDAKKVGKARKPFTMLTNWL